jgi:hypothetical protein
MAHPFRPTQQIRNKRRPQKNQGYDLVKELADLKLSVKSLYKILSIRTTRPASDKNLNRHSRK